ncbi:hypothetical protein D5S18_23940 [Nocardia panacis]|uniref:Barstar (barnase inhibitor) domain-containing protein n=1 Tax=Nocardia panacis TaxID=2340916 RepID=A0A3A4JYF0_9NOCA|nr:barstar family protein [Nocardia panacis]RJO72213.1 hypothetical protein D5S18_23940 [Nocardia panacis]
MAISLREFLEPVSQTTAAAGPRPVIGALEVGAAEFSGVRGSVPSGYLVRELRGSKMIAVAGVFDEFAAAFQFPYYFGANKDAFDECLRDLDDFVGPAAGYVAVIRDSELVLAERPRERDWLASAFADSATHWAARGVVFRVVLQGAPGRHAAALRL